MLQYTSWPGGEVETLGTANPRLRGFDSRPGLTLAPRQIVDALAIFLTEVYLKLYVGKVLHTAVFLEEFAEFRAIAFGEVEYCCLVLVRKYREEDVDVAQVGGDIGMSDCDERFAVGLAREEFSRHVRDRFRDLCLTSAAHRLLSRRNDVFEDVALGDFEGRIYLCAKLCAAFDSRDILFVALKVGDLPRTYCKLTTDDAHDATLFHDALRHRTSDDVRLFLTTELSDDARSPRDLLHCASWLESS